MTDRAQKNKKKPSMAKLLAWYDRHARVLPWRAAKGKKPDPYHVWLSEIMLQQTTVTVVGPYFLKFLARWPTIADLAKASLDEVYQMWAGLGYYRRARGLHECAQVVMKDYVGVFPEQEELLLALPGIGPYTAAAICAIAFDKRANVVDGNVERVMARLFAEKTPLPQGKKKLKLCAKSCLPDARYGDHAQALMDLGATVCTPQSPKCGLCPLQGDCLAFERGMAEKLPQRAPKKAKPVRYGYAFILWDKNGRVLLRRRPAEGLLANMMEPPTTPWIEDAGFSWQKARKFAPSKAKWTHLSAVVHHTFTHFDLELRIVEANCADDADGVWVEPKHWPDQALPSVMRKVLAVAREKRIKE